jgi:hypothetical protein
MFKHELRKLYLPALLVIFTILTNARQFPPAANGGSFMVQCATTTITHPTALAPDAPEPPYLGPAVNLTVRTKPMLLAGLLASSILPSTVFAQSVPNQDGLGQTAGGVLF